MQQNRGWSARNIPQSQDIRNVSQANNQPLNNTPRRGGNEEYEVWSRRTKPDEARSAALAERAKQLKEEEEKREKEQRGAANKKLNELLDKKITEKKIDAKVCDETKGTINPAAVPRQPIIPVPIPVPGWEKDRENRERESDPSVRDIEPVRVSAPPTNEFRQFTMVEGRGIQRSDTKNSDRDIIRDRGERIDMRNERDRDREMREQRDNRTDNRKGPTYSTSFQLPPRFLRQQERHKTAGGSATSPQLSNVSNPKPVNQPPPASSPLNPPFAQHDESRWQPQNRRHRNDSDMEEEHREIRRERYTPDENRYRQHRSYGDSNLRKSGSSTDARDFSKDNRDSREREIRDSRDRDRYYDDRNNYRNQDYDYDKREHSDHDRKDRDRYDDRNIRSDEKNLSYDRDDRDRDIPRQDDYRDRRDFERYCRDNGKDLERQRNDDSRRMHHPYDRDDRVRDHDRLNTRDVRDRDDHRYRDERPQRPDSRDSRTSRESRHSRDSMRELETSREYSGSWADERAPFEEEKRKDTYREERDRRVPGPITREKLEADELRNDKRNLQPQTLKRSTSGHSIDKKPEMKAIEEKKVPANDEDWNVNKKETTPVRELVDTASSPKAWADAISSSTITPENIKPVENIEEPINQNIETSIQTEAKEVISSDIKFLKDDAKEKDDKRGPRTSGHNRGGRDNRNRWGSGYSVYNNRGGWNGPTGGGNNSGSGRRIAPPRMGPHRPPSSRSNDWKHTDSELSGDDISASNESVKDDRRIQRSPKPIRKLEKDEKNMEVKQDKNVCSDRRFDKPRGYESSRPVSSNTREPPIVPRGEPSRWGRGNFRPSRGAGTGKRMDGYGPPPSKSPFSTQYAIDTSDKEKKDESEIFSSDEKLKFKSNVSRSHSQTKSVPGEVPPRMQRKSDSESRRDRSNERDNRAKTNKHSDEYGETTSENSDTEGDRKDLKNTPPVNQQTQRQNSNNSSVSNSSNRSRSGSQSQLSNNGRSNNDKRPTSSNTYQGRPSNQSQPLRQNSSGNLRDKYSNSAKPKETRTDEIKTDAKILTNAITDLKISSPPYEEKHDEDYKNENLDSNIGESSKSNDLDGFQEVRSKKAVKPKDEKEKYLQSKKIEKETIITSRNQKPNSPIQMSHHTTNIPPLMATHISQPKNQFDRGRQKTIVAPRFLKQRENRIQKHMQQSMCDVNEMNKLNQNESMYSVKDSGGAGYMSQVNAWDKQVSTQLRTTIDVDSINLGIDKSNEMDQVSCSSSQRNSPNTGK